MAMDGGRTHKRRRGVTLIETIVGIGIFTIIAIGLYGTYLQLAKLARTARIRTVATALANEYLEVARNLPYASVGVVGGIPAGILPASQTETRDGIPLLARYYVRNVDDPFDGQLTGGSNLVAYTDQNLNYGWGNWSWGFTSITWDSTEQVYQGTTSIKTVIPGQGQYGSGFKIGYGEPIDPADYPTLEFAVYTDTPTTLTLRLDGPDIPKQVQAGWTHFSLAVAELNPSLEPFQSFAILNMETTQQTLYLDDIKFVGGRDLSPADYKLVTVEVSCATCATTPVIRLSTFVAAKALETASSNGALFLQVLDANAQPVPGASIHLENTTLNPAISIDDVTDGAGWLKIIDAPPAQESYRVVVTKAGYSSDRTYAPDDPIVINPLKVDATVATQQVTQATFMIDRTSTLNVATATATCSSVGGLSFNLKGAKLVSQAPDVLKYDQNHTTNGNGTLTLSGLEWDSYTPQLTTPSYQLRGTIPLTPINLPPNTTQDLTLVVQPTDPYALQVVVRDSGNQLPVANASVRLSGDNYDTTKVTNQGYLLQTDWSGGPGQVTFTDPARYYSDDGNVSTTTSAGEILLARLGNEYMPEGQLESSTFDTGITSNFVSLNWLPASQPPQTGQTPVKFQIATNNDNETWNFVGPDGTANTYYTTNGQALNAIHNGDRYLRYRVFLSTENSQLTPNISEVSITYTSSCLPPGQTFFSGLSAGNYTLEVSHNNYQTTSLPVNLSSAWTKQEINLIPN